MKALITFAISLSILALCTGQRSEKLYIASNSVTHKVNYIDSVRMMMQRNQLLLMQAKKPKAKTKAKQSYINFDTLAPIKENYMYYPSDIIIGQRQFRYEY